ELRKDAVISGGGVGVVKSRDSASQRCGADLSRERKIDEQHTSDSFVASRDWMDLDGECRVGIDQYRVGRRELDGCEPAHLDRAKQSIVGGSSCRGRGKVQLVRIAHTVGRSISAEH